jgi:membrane protein insertase Oxa1/YidC/SpoIIIJ
MKHRLRTLATLVVATAALTLALASNAFAGDGGQGWYGPASDKVVTFFGLGLVLLFPLLCLVLTLVQSRLENRAQEKKKIFK